MAEERSRLLTVLGGIHLFLGLYLSAALFIDLPSTWSIVQHSRTYSVPAYSWTMGQTLLLGVLSVVSGTLLLRRAAWAPLLAAAVGGAVLLDALYALYLYGEMNVRLIGRIPREQKYLNMTASYVTMTVLEVVRALTWLVTLGTLYQKKHRAAFPVSRPEATTRNLWTTFGVSLGVCVLLHGWVYVLGWLGWIDRQGRLKSME